jgi:hypothetical protein
LTDWRRKQPQYATASDSGDQRAILVKGGQVPAQVIALRHGRAPSLLSTDDGVTSWRPAPIPSLIRGRAERRAMVARKAAALPVSQQCRLLAVPRFSVYRRIARGQRRRPR